MKIISISDIHYSKNRGGRDILDSLIELIDKIKSSGVNWHLTEAEKAVLRLDWYKKSVRSPEALIKRFNREILEKNEINIT